MFLTSTQWCHLLCWSTTDFVSCKETLWRMPEKVTSDLQSQLFSSHRCSTIHLTFVEDAFSCFPHIPECVDIDIDILIYLWDDRKYCLYNQPLQPLFSADCLTFKTQTMSTSLLYRILLFIVWSTFSRFLVATNASSMCSPISLTRCWCRPNQHSIVKIHTIGQIHTFYTIYTIQP